MDEPIVFKFLNSNYQIIIGNDDFVVLDKIYNNTINKSIFKESMRMVLGSTPFIIRICEYWVKTNEEFLSKDLIEFFHSLDLEKGSFLLSADCLHYKTHDPNTSVGNISLGSAFLFKQFSKFYFENHLKDKIDAYLKDFDMSLGSKILLNTILGEYSKETASVLDMCIGYVNNYYYTNILTKDLREFLDNTYVELGRSNWIFKHKVHGEIDELGPYFTKENEWQIKAINTILKDWIQNKIIDTSEKMMENN